MRVIDLRCENDPKKPQPSRTVGFLVFEPVSVFRESAATFATADVGVRGKNSWRQSSSLRPLIVAGVGEAGGGGDIYYYKLLKQSRDTLEMSLPSRLASGNRHFCVCMTFSRSAVIL